MDLAAIAVAALGILILLAMIVQFFLWLRVKYEVKTGLVEWKGVIDVAAKESRSAQASVEGFAAADSAASAKLQNALAEIHGAIKACELKQTALEESFAHFNAKTIARERELTKAQKRDRNSRSTSPAGYDDLEGSGEGDGFREDGPLLAAITQAERAAAQANNRSNGGASASQGPAGTGPRLRPKRS